MVLSEDEHTHTKNTVKATSRHRLVPRWMIGASSTSCATRGEDGKSKKIARQGNKDDFWYGWSVGSYYYY